MTSSYRTILVTGGAGFIGSALVRQLMAESDARVVVVDVLTYAGNLESLAGALGEARCGFERVDICDAVALRDVFARHRPDAVVHLAAESHVDRSITGAAPFIRTNVEGTFTLLEAARAHWQSLDAAAAAAFRFVHVSTDEVYGSLEANDAPFTEESRYRPNSPYAASKAASDHLARAWQHTYGLPVVVTNCSNNYGPYQFPEKLIPLALLKAIAGEPIPVYGRGENVRDWLYVDDHARALRLALAHGQPGRTYVVGGRAERRNIDVVHALCDALDALRPRADGSSHRALIRFVEDRPGHDFRYAIDPARAERELGWQPTETFESGLRRTVAWYLANETWWRHVLDGSYRLERLGTLDRRAAS